MFVNNNTFDERRFQREDSFNTYVIRHLTNRETFLVAVSRDTNNHAPVLLDTLLVTFFDTISYGNSVTTSE